MNLEIFAIFMERSIQNSRLTDLECEFEKTDLKLRLDNLRMASSQDTGGRCFIREWQLKESLKKASLMVIWFEWSREKISFNTFEEDTKWDKEMVTVSWDSVKENTKEIFKPINFMESGLIQMLITPSISGNLVWTQSKVSANKRKKAQSTENGQEYKLVFATSNRTKLTNLQRFSKKSSSRERKSSICTKSYSLAKLRLKKLSRNQS